MQSAHLAVILAVLLAIAVLPAVAVVLASAVGFVVWLIRRPDHAAPAEAFIAGIGAALGIYAILLALVALVLLLIE